MVLAAYVEKSGVYKVEQGGIFKPACFVGTTENRYSSGWFPWNGKQRLTTG